MGGFREIEVISFRHEESGVEFYSLEEAQFHQVVARQVEDAGLGTVRVAISETPEEINPNLRRVTYTAVPHSVEWVAFDQARRVQPDRAASESYCWLPGQREKAAAQVVQRYARYATPR